ncbi:MAG: hypothetical protein UU23_C0001G0056 [Candidatus Curtissbacteria bacterium GW2011_GWA1_40_9]|uniref:DUF86 domain-containing protein n=1 Tax=Candidatus Curtissbacteria bacterium GW2011_GWA1_40_9 TaxID=1618408 RepID=A0A0G0WSD3_9BACT|nr:MAG: hypothetical protein UU23_C0001G0056 [Candidatus Curtissbacteria bacterium GW2011_GWA1_40_9]
MPIDKTLILKKLDFLNQHLTRIEQMEFNQQSFIKDEDIHDLVTFRLQQAVETAIDIAAHVIAESNLPHKETAKDAFLLLGERSIIDDKLAKKMGKAADFRNRVVHGYNDFDYSLLFADYKENITDLRNFAAQILKILEKNR